MNEDPSLNDALVRLEAAQQAAKGSATKARGDDLTVSEAVGSWLRFLWQWRRALLRMAVLFLVLGIAAALVIPAKYTTRATILPPENSGSGLSGLLSALPMAAAQMLGSGGDSKMTELYVDIAKSETVLADVLNAPYKNGTIRDALRGSANTPDWKLIETLRQEFAGSKHPRTQLVMFELTGHDPELVSAVLGEILKEMEVFFHTRMATTESRQRKMIEKRLGEVSDTLHMTEEQLRQFKESNRLTILSPKLTMDEGRLLRQVEINNAVYVELTKQLELAKINETETMPVLNVLDYPTPPDRRSGPSRLMILLGSLGFGFVLTTGGLQFHDKLPPVARKWFDKASGLKAALGHE
jgi:uncharacterized protein involved in exopolysaccharide biosynthesis